MEDAFHGNSDSVVVSVDRFWVVRPAGWVERLSGGQEGFDSFVSEDEQRRHRSEPGWERLVAAGVADPADDVFAAEFLQIIPGMAGAVLAWALFTECAHVISTSGSGQMMPLPMNEFLQQSMQAAGFDLDFEVVEWGAMLLGYRSAPDAPASKGVDALNISLS